jgi:hypothetical protein
LPPKYKHTKLDAYARIASTVITYRYVLQELGYPSWVAASRLNAYESQAVREVTSGKSNIGDSPSLAAAIRRDMRAYTQTGKSLRGFIWTAGCGAGEFTLTLMPQPSTARIFIIPSFFYELCRAQRINPNDVDSCEHWREVLGNKIDDAAGEYHYFVRWSDGAVRRGVINADDFYKLAAFGKPLRLFRP